MMEQQKVPWYESKVSKIFFYLEISCLLEGSQSSFRMLFIMTC